MEINFQDVLDIYKQKLADIECELILMTVSNKQLQERIKELEDNKEDN